MKIERILIEDQMAPIGLDEKKPVFSWLLTAEEGEQNLMQSACRIVVRTGEDTVWDSGRTAGWGKKYLCGSDSGGKRIL